MSGCSIRSNNNNTRHYPPFDLTPDPRFGPPSAPFPPCADTNDISTSTAPARITACTSSAPSWRATETPDARQVRTNRTYSCLATVHSVPVNDTPGRVSRRSHAALDNGRRCQGQHCSISSTKDRDRCYQEAGSSSTSETPRGSLDLRTCLPTTGISRQLSTLSLFSTCAVTVNVFRTASSHQLSFVIKPHPHLLLISVISSIFRLRPSRDIMSVPAHRAAGRL